MVTALDLIVEAERRGARFCVLGDRLEATPARVFDTALVTEIGKHKPEIVAVLLERSALTATDAVLAAQRLLREGLWPKVAPEDCRFFIGHGADAVCRRCGSSWDEHITRAKGGER